MSILERITQVALWIGKREGYRFAEGAVTLQARLDADLSFDSLTTRQFLLAIEDEFDVSIPDEDADRLITVGELVAYIQTQTREGALMLAAA